MERVLTPGWATYLRVSDEDKQSPERSFSMQRKMIQDQLIEKSDIEIFREYQDRVSGKTSNRAQYQQMLRDAEDGKFSHVGLYKADRFGRNTLEGMQTAEKLIGLGIKIRIAYSPSQRPEEPDGNLMFQLQMALAQREVDILSQRTRDGSEAKMRAGGWPNRAPAGYVNVERQINSGKYHRWIEKDPEHNHVIRQAWDLLLTDRYTLDEICEELNRLGYSRKSGRPWAWNTPSKRVRKTAKSPLQVIFHNSFYTGWGTSKLYGVAYGDIRGDWEPTILKEEYERGIEILRKHDHQKVRSVRRYYLLRNLLWVNNETSTLKMYGSTPTGRDQVYAYYRTHSKIDNKNVRVPCNLVDDQISNWLDGLCVKQEQVPEIRNIYSDDLNVINGEDKGKKLEDLKQKASANRFQEAHLARLLVTNKITEETYDQLHSEWKEKLKNFELSIRDLERETETYLDDLELALILMSKLSSIYPRLGEKEKTTLLRILAKKIIVNKQGEIIDQKLNSPFVYLKSILDNYSNNGSSWVLSVCRLKCTSRLHQECTG